MTSADLQSVLEAHDAQGCIALFATATEAERRAVAKMAAARLKTVTAGIPSRMMSHLQLIPNDSLRIFDPTAAAHRGGIRAAQIAVLATATLGALKKFGVYCFPPIDDATAVLSGRRPPWVGEWVEEIVSWGNINDHLFDIGDRWCFVRRLIREGFCQRPRNDRYIYCMIGGISTHRSGKSIRAALLDDPELLDDEVWEIFEVEPMPGRVALFPVDPHGPPESRWEMALAELADAGRLSRTRLLDASLGGLERDFPEARAKWFAFMHETLRPTDSERAERAGRYRGLAASHVPSTVTFALNALTALEKAGRHEPALLVDAVGPALLARAKGTVQAALALIASAARRDPALRQRAATVAVDALAHESPAVHEAVVDLIVRHGEPADRALADLLRARVETIAASQRARLASWLGPEAAPEGPEVTADNLDDLVERAAALDPRLAALAGVGIAVDVLKQARGEVPAIDFPETAVPRLDPGQAIVPVADLDALIGLFSAVLENPENPDDLERVLDGVSRLCGQRPADFAARTGPLRARAERQGEISSALVPSLGGLALGWIAGRPQNVVYAGMYGSLIGVFARRVLAIARRAAERQAAPLLGAPTHLGGWIDPRVLVERVKTWASLPFRSERLDGSLALLRLAPDPGPRAEALRAAAPLEGPYAAALRHALGGNGELVGPDARLWVAAARARAARDDDPLVEARHPGLGPDAGRAARCSLQPGPCPSHSWQTRSMIAREPALPPAGGQDLPTVLLHDRQAHGADDITRWVASIWPLGRDSFFAAGAETLLGRDYAPSYARWYRPLLEPLLDPDVPLGPMARLLLAGTLSSNRPELQGLAIDALIAAVDDGRLDGRLLGEALQQLLTEALVKPTRLAKALGDAAQVSPLHTRVAAYALQVALLGLAPPPRDCHLLLELLKELLVETGERLSVPGAEAFLKDLTVTGKTAKLTRDLLGLSGGSSTLSRSSAAARALAGRVERAERWTRIIQGDMRCHQAAVPH